MAFLLGRRWGRGRGRYVVDGVYDRNDIVATICNIVGVSPKYPYVYAVYTNDARNTSRMEGLWNISLAVLLKKKKYV